MIKFHNVQLVLWLLAGVLLAAATLPKHGYAGAVDPQPFQFSDEFYRDNGIDPGKIIDKLDCGDPRTACDEVAPGENFSDVRIRETTGGFEQDGKLLYYTVPGKLGPDAFLANEAGRRARNLADTFIAYLFPRAGGNPLSPAFPNRRQDNIFDTRGGYFSNNPLGLWRITFVSWDGPNVARMHCRDTMDHMADSNGLDLDGTPVIRTVAEIENLADDR